MQDKFDTLLENISGGQISEAVDKANAAKVNTDLLVRRAQSLVKDVNTLADDPKTDPRVLEAITKLVLAGYQFAETCRGLVKFANRGSPRQVEIIMGKAKKDLSRLGPEFTRGL